MFDGAAHSNVSEKRLPPASTSCVNRGQVSIPILDGAKNVYITARGTAMQKQNGSSCKPVSPGL